jgi:hypothetical protein
MTEIMKWVCICMLGLALLELPIADHQSLLAFVVCASSLLVIAEAVRAGKYPWAFAFLAIAVLFNPLLPIARSTRDLVWLNGITLAAFFSAAVFLKADPRLTALSITSLLPRRRSL